MDQEEDKLEQSHDPAEALSQMANQAQQEPSASQEQLNPSAFLEELAQQNDFQEEEEPISLQEDFSAADTSLIENLDNEDSVSEDTLEPLGQSHPGKVSRKITVNDLGEGYKKVLVPFLAVLSGLLVLVGVLSIVMLTEATPEEKASQWYSRMKAITYASFFLAIVLFFGARWLYQQIKARS